MVHWSNINIISLSHRQSYLYLSLGNVKPHSKSEAVQSLRDKFINFKTATKQQYSYLNRTQNTPTEIPFGRSIKFKIDDSFAFARRI